jgi:hypothetical protein
VPADIRVIVSLGPEHRTVTVPDLRGSNQSVLIAMFETLELIPVFSEREDITPVGTVIEIQNVNETVTVPIEIHVVLSTGPPEEPPEVPTDPGEEQPGPGEAPGE